MDRVGAQRVIGSGAMRVGELGAFDVLLRAGSSERRESEVDAGDRRAVDEAAVLRFTADDGLAWRSGVGSHEKRVARLMRVMGLQAVLPGPHTSRAHPEHRVYPYLLRDLEIQRPNQVWCSDITYVPMRRGFLYLVVVMDWFSRYVLAWELSNTLEVLFCVEALQQALGIGHPEIFNTDQGAQFTSEEFTGKLQGAGIRISMDGRGRALDNVMVERLWRSVKYEEIYLWDYADGKEAWQRLSWYFPFYNTQRRHQGLSRQTPAEVYFG